MENLTYNQKLLLDWVGKNFKDLAEMNWISRNEIEIVDQNGGKMTFKITGNQKIYADETHLVAMMDGHWINFNY